MHIFIAFIIHLCIFNTEGLSPCSEYCSEVKPKGVSNMDKLQNRKTLKATAVKRQKTPHSYTDLELREQAISYFYLSARTPQKLFKPAAVKRQKTPYSYTDLELREQDTGHFYLSARTPQSYKPHQKSFTTTAVKRQKTPYSYTDLELREQAISYFYLSARTPQKLFKPAVVKRQKTRCSYTDLELREQDISRFYLSARTPQSYKTHSQSTGTDYSLPLSPQIALNYSALGSNTC